MFEGFTLKYVDVDEVTLRLRHGGHAQRGRAAARPSADAYHVAPGPALHRPLDGYPPASACRPRWSSDPLILGSTVRCTW
jgi:hypothetical protein